MRSHNQHCLLTAKYLGHSLKYNDSLNQNEKDNDIINFRKKSNLGHKYGIPFFVFDINMVVQYHM